MAGSSPRRDRPFEFLEQIFIERLHRFHERRNATARRTAQQTPNDVTCPGTLDRFTCDARLIPEGVAPAPSLDQAFCPQPIDDLRRCGVDAASRDAQAAVQFPHRRRAEPPQLTQHGEFELIGRQSERLHDPITTLVVSAHVTTLVVEMQARRALRARDGVDGESAAPSPPSRNAMHPPRHWLRPRRSAANVADFRTPHYPPGSAQCTARRRAAAARVAYQVTRGFSLQPAESTGLPKARSNSQNDSPATAESSTELV